MPLLSLPQELRDAILIYALVDHCPPFTVADGLSPDAFEEADDLDQKAWVASKGIYYRHRRRGNAAASLLQTNHQLRKDTASILDRYHKQHGNRYKLDIALVGEMQLYCSWLQIPPLRREVDCLEVTFHIQGMSGRRNGFMDNGGGTGSAVWRLYSVVERFLRCGACIPKTRSCDFELNVKEMIIKVLSPDLKHPQNANCIIADASISPDRIPEYRRAWNMRAVLDPEALARFMFVWFEGLMRMSDVSYALPGAPFRRYGRQFIERLGRVKMSAEGGREYVAYPKDYESPRDFPSTSERGIVDHVGMFEG